MKPSDIHHQAAIRQANAEVMALERALESLYSRTGKALIEHTEAAAIQADRYTESLVRAKKHLAGLRGDLLCPACQASNPRDNNFCEAPTWPTWSTRLPCWP